MLGLLLGCLFRLCWLLSWRMLTLYEPTCAWFGFTPAGSHRVGGSVLFFGRVSTCGRLLLRRWRGPLSCLWFGRLVVGLVVPPCRSPRLLGCSLSPGWFFWVSSSWLFCCCWAWLGSFFPWLVFCSLFAPSLIRPHCIVGWRFKPPCAEIHALACVAVVGLGLGFGNDDRAADRSRHLGCKRK